VASRASGNRAQDSGSDERPDISSPSHRHPHYLFFPQENINYFIKRHNVLPLPLGLICFPSDQPNKAKEILSMHVPSVPFNEEGWRYILEEHNGHLPIKIKAIPEGTVLPTKNILFSVENTDPKCYWLVGYLETLLVQTWYPCTVATFSHEMKKRIKRKLDKTADSDAGIDFQLHDFGFRGVSSVESAGIGGCAHLVNFKGTDTMQALLVARNYYQAECAGFSVPASEHSTVTVWQRDGEIDAYRNMVEKFENGIVSIVSDSYDIYNACSEIWGTQLKDMVVTRGSKSGNVVVIRPDSGDPATVVCKLLTILGEKFGSTTNSKGFKVLPPYIRILQGDGIGLESTEIILEKVAQAGWSVENVVLGCGGGLLQKHNRDTLKFAFKCSLATVNGANVEVWKAPIDDPVKKSKRGKLALILNSENKYETIQNAQNEPDLKCCLETVFTNGQLHIDHDLETIRSRTSNCL